MFLTLLGGVGLSHILTDSSIVEKLIKNPLEKIKNLTSNKIITTLINNFLEMMNCYQCSGFWSGLIVGLLLSNGILLSIILGFGVSFLSMFFAVIMMKLNGEE